MKNFLSTGGDPPADAPLVNWNMTSLHDARKVHWHSLARQWEYFGPPLRPSPEDVEFVAQTLKDQRARTRGDSFAALLLGVTPELAALEWPAGTSLTAVDQNPAMIELVWPGSTAARERLVCGDWMAAPLERRSFDTIIGDGVLSMLPFPAGYRQLAAAMGSLAKSGAILCLRLYVPPDTPESPEAVIDDLLENKIGSFHALKLRLLMALHGADDSSGVRVNDVWNYWNRAQIDVPKLVERGWPLEVIRMIDAYRGSPASYSFPAFHAIVSLIGEFADVIQVSRPSYELGERCPSVSFRFRD